MKTLDGFKPARAVSRNARRLAIMVSVLASTLVGSISSYATKLGIQTTEPYLLQGQTNRVVVGYMYETSEPPTKKNLIGVGLRELEITFKKSIGNLPKNFNLFGQAPELLAYSEPELRKKGFKKKRLLIFDLLSKTFEIDIHPRSNKDYW